MPRLVAAVVAAVFLAACSSGRGPVPSGDLEIAGSTSFVRFDEAEREPAPTLEGEALDDADEAIDAGFVAGKVAVVNFWGSWCGPCRVEQPILEAAWREMGDEVVFVGVNTRNDQRAAALAFLDEFDVTYPSIYDPGQNLAHAFRVRYMPATFVIDAEGRIAAQIIGAVDSADVIRDLVEEAR